MIAAPGNAGLFRISDDLYRVLDQPPNPLFETAEPAWITAEPAMPVLEMRLRVREWAMGLFLAGLLRAPPGPPEAVDDGRSVGSIIEMYDVRTTVDAFLGSPTTFMGVVSRGRIHYVDRRADHLKGHRSRNDRLGFEHLLFSFDPNRESPTIHIDFGDRIQGGVFEAVAYLFAFMPPPLGTARFRQKVLGRNPTRAQVRSELARQAARSGLASRALDLCVIAYVESRFRQFVESGKDRGQPLYGTPSGYGIMQIDDPRPTPEQIWNWKANVAMGIRIYQGYLSGALAHLRSLEARWPAAAKFTQVQIRMEFFQRYNTGPGNPFWGVWDGAQWQPNPRNRFNWYGFNCERIYELVNAGHSPPGWQD